MGEAKNTADQLKELRHQLKQQHLIVAAQEVAIRYLLSRLMDRAAADHGEADMLKTLRLGAIQMSRATRPDDSMTLAIVHGVDPHLKTLAAGAAYAASEPPLDG